MMNPWTLQKVYFSIGNTTIMKKIRNHRTQGLSANLSIYSGNIKILEINRSNQKRGTPRMLIIIVVFEEKTMLRLQDKKGELQECL